MTVATRAWGFGLVTISHDGQVLDTWFPAPHLGAADDGVDRGIMPLELTSAEYVDDVRGVRTEAQLVDIDLTAAPATVPDAYLRLHLLSHLLVQPNTVNLDGLFGVLPNVAWTTAGPVPADELATRRVALQRAGISVVSLDKFPRLLDYVVPTRVRIADAQRVRLGAHLSAGTTIMHEGFVNFNAGTLGESMVEGRISQGVVVDNGSDIGGGASIMGTLSGGGTERVSIGKRCLLGANSGLGISLGDDCIIEAGLYVTAGTKVTLVGGDTAGTVVSARTLSGASNLTFRRNSTTGVVEVLERSGHGVTLNAALHA